MENILDEYKEANEYVSLMYENTDKATGNLVFHGLYHDNETGEEQYRFHMNWTKDDVDSVKAAHEKLVEYITALSKFGDDLTEANAAEIINDAALLKVWNTYMKEFTGDALHTEEITEILDKKESIFLADCVRKKISKKEELTDIDREMLDDYGGLTLSEADKAAFYKFMDARFKQSDERVGSSEFSLNVIVFARRLCKLLQLGAPEIIIRSEKTQLMIAMALHRYCDGYEKLAEI